MLSLDIMTIYAIKKSKMHLAIVIIMHDTHDLNYIIEPPLDKTNKMACAPSEDSDQPGHLPSLIRVFAVRSVGS